MEKQKKGEPNHMNRILQIIALLTICFMMFVGCQGQKNYHSNNEETGYYFQSAQMQEKPQTNNKQESSSQGKESSSMQDESEEEHTNSHSSIPQQSSEAQIQQSNREESEQTQQETITCTISIDCYAAVDAGYKMAEKVSKNGVILSKMTLKLPVSATVFDALQQGTKQKNIPVVKAGSGKRVYVVAINSLEEGSCGGESGWMFSVNGVYGNKSCSEQILKDGDRIQWRYTTNFGMDIGAHL